jgi:multidrug resistance efflux pump
MKPSWKLARRAALPIIGVTLIGYAAATISTPPLDVRDPRLPPPTPSDPSAPVVAAVGVIEPVSETISIGAPMQGIVSRVRVTPGERVEAGDVLFELDARDAIANARAARAAIEENARSAEALRARVATTRAAADVARSQLDDARARFALFDALSDPAAVSRDERDRAAFAVRRAEAQYAQAQAGVREAEASARQATASTDRSAAQARLAQTRADILVVRAPIGGQVLAVNVRPGELAATGGDPLVALGETRTLHVRVEIDEEDVGRLQRKGTAEGVLRAAPDQRLALRFVRFEPLTRPKRNLAGGAERIDTRVVEALYAFDPADSPAFIGMRMDVFLAARTPQPAS